MLSVEELKFSYSKDHYILNNVAFDALAGQCVSILGNNGAGKSTLIKCLNRILKPQNGVVMVNGKSMNTLKRNTIAKYMAYVSQHNVSDQMTVFDSVLLGRKPYIKIEPTQKDIEITKEVIKRIGLEPFSLRYTDELSGGEMQKVMLARALAQQPKILLLDEPTSNLDLRNQYECMEVVKKIALQEKISVIIVIHDLNLALRYSDRFLFMKESKIYAYGGLEIMTSANVSEVYDMPIVVEQVHGIPIVIPMPQGCDKDNKTNLDD